MAQRVELTVHQFKAPRVINLAKSTHETRKYQKNYCAIKERQIAQAQTQDTTESGGVVVVDLTKDSQSPQPAGDKVVIDLTNDE